MKKWKRIEPTVPAKIGWRTIVTKTFKMPDGRITTFQTLGAEDTHCIATIAVTVEGKVIVAKQFRPGPESFMYELPGGGADKDEDFEVAARRELLEETGYAAGEMLFLGNVYKDAYQNATWHYFLAAGCSPHASGQTLDDHEHVDVHLITINTLMDNARKGRMTDTEAVLLAYENLVELRSKV
jgi:ADP-ribose pyrophosphatase